MEIVEYAQKWFELNGIPSKIDCNTILLNLECGFEVEVSEREVKHRAELYLESELAKINS